MILKYLELTHKLHSVDVLKLVSLLHKMIFLSLWSCCLMGAVNIFKKPDAHMLLMPSRSYLVCWTSGAGLWWVYSSSPDLQPEWRCMTAGQWCTGCPSGRPMLPSDSWDSSVQRDPVRKKAKTKMRLSPGACATRERTPATETITEPVSLEAGGCFKDECLATFLTILNDKCRHTV